MQRSKCQVEAARKPGKGGGGGGAEKGVSDLCAKTFVTSIWTTHEGDPHSCYSRHTPVDTPPVQLALGRYGPGCTLLLAASPYGTLEGLGSGCGKVRTMQV